MSFLPWLPLLFAAPQAGCPVECGDQCPEPCPTFAAACDVPYGHKPWHTLDVYLPAGWDPDTNTLPVVFYVHGGGWSNGDKRCAQVLPFVDTLLGLGYPVVSVNYLLADPVERPGTWPRPILDLKQALHWVKSEGLAPPYDLPDCVVATGTSAGGHLAALLGSTWEVFSLIPYFPTPFDAFRPDLVVSFSGPTDFFSLGCNGWCLDDSCAACPAGVVCGDLDGPGLDTPYELWLGCAWEDRTFANGTPAFGRCRAFPCGAPPSYPLFERTGDPFVDASPRAWVDPSDPPVYQFGALCDPLVPPEQLNDYHDALLQAGVASGIQIETSAPSGCGHAFGIYGPVGSAVQLDVVIQQWWPQNGAPCIGG